MANMNLRKINLIREMERKRTGEHGGNYGRDEPWEYDRHKMTYMPPYIEPEMRRYPRMGYDDDMPMDRRMGFGEHNGYEHEMLRRRSDGTWMNHGGYGGEEEPIRFGGMVSTSGGKEKRHQKMTREMAEQWVENMHGDDPAKPSGGKWTPDQIKPIATKYGVPTEGERFWEFWSVMNAMYSDYYSVAKKYNALNPDFFADLAMAFINDKDAVPNKVAIYYECIAKC